MVNLLRDVPIGSKVPKEINVVIEIPRGSKNKYEYDTKHDYFKLNRILHSTVYYPGDYGFIPQTIADDGDPVDVLILVNEPNITGVIVPARPIALLKMTDNKQNDDKIIAVPVGDPNFDNIKKKEDLPPHLLKEIIQFFETYGLLEKSKKIKVKGLEGKQKAFDHINEAIKKFK